MGGFVYAAFFGALLYLFPVFVWAEVYADAKERKAWFSLSLFRRIRVFGGYAELRKEGLAVHLTKKKAVLLPYSEMTETRKKFEIAQGFQIWRFRQVVEIGGANRPYGVMLAALLQTAGAQAFAILKTRHPFLSVGSSTLLNNRPVFKLSVQTALVFNGLVLTVALIKKTLEVFLNWIAKIRSGPSWKRQPSS